MYEQMMLPVAIGYPKLPKHQTMPQHLFLGLLVGVLKHAAACCNMLRHAALHSTCCGMPACRSTLKVGVGLFGKKYRTKISIPSLSRGSQYSSG